MLIDVVDRYLPAIGVVAELAFRPVLAPMQIGMAVLAFVGSIGEFEIGMAVPACHRRMAAAQRKPCLRMIKSNLVADYLPICNSVAGFARQLEWTVRILGGGRERS